MIQSLNAIATVYTGRGQSREARRWLDRAFELAQQTSSPLVIDFVAGSLAHNLIQTDDPARGVALLEGLLTRPANRFYFFYGQLADGYFTLGQSARSVEAASMAISLAREESKVDLLTPTLVFGRKPTRSSVNSRKRCRMRGKRSRSSSRSAPMRSEPMK